MTKKKKQCPMKRPLMNEWPQFRSSESLHLISVFQTHHRGVMKQNNTNCINIQMLIYLTGRILIKILNC